MLAPPLSIASISAKLHGVRWNLFGSSFLSENSPLPSLIGPSSRALRPPIAPYGVCADDACCGALEEDDCLWLPFSGPCCVACSRYDANDSGSAEEGDSGWTLGEWSISAESVSMWHCRIEIEMCALCGVERLPKKRIIGCRCWRSLRVACISMAEMG